MTRPEGPPEVLEFRRKTAVRLLDKGLGVREVAEFFDVNPGSVSRWRQTYEEEGMAGLDPTPHPGPRPKLTDEDLAELEEFLLEGPQAHGFETERWTIDRVATVIEREFDESLANSTVWEYLDQLGWSYQQPERWARERDDEEVETWRTEEWPRIKKSPGE